MNPVNQNKAVGWKATMITFVFGFGSVIFINSCYQLEDLTPNYEDGRSTVVYDLPGDTLASDGWEDHFEEGDTYLRQRYFNTRYTDSIRFVPHGNEVINAAVAVNASSEESVKWLSESASHPTDPSENEAYRNNSDGYQYIFRSNAWYQMGIDGHLGTAENDGSVINWRGALASPPANPQAGWAYADTDNGRIYQYNGKAWALMVNDANYRENQDFIQVDYSKSGKETGRFSMFIFRFRDGWQQFIRDAADSARYLRTADWDIAFTGEMNAHVWLNNARYNLNPGFGGPVLRSSLWPYEYGYDFMNEAPEDEFFDAKPASELQIGYTSEFGPGVNPWYEYGSTFIARPFPYKAFYLRLESINPQTGESTVRYGKLQLISPYKGAPEVLTDRNWPSPYLTFRYFIQEDGSRNVRTRD